MKVNKNIITKYLDKSKQYDIKFCLVIFEDNKFMSDEMWNDLLTDDQEKFLAKISILDKKRSFKSYDDSCKMILMTYIDKYYGKIDMAKFIEIINDFQIIQFLDGIDLEKFMFNLDTVVDLLRNECINNHESLTPVKNACTTIFKKENLSRDDINKFINISTSMINFDLDKYDISPKIVESSDQFEKIIDRFNLNIFDDKVDIKNRDRYLQLFYNFSIHENYDLEKKQQKYDFYSSNKKLSAILRLGHIFKENSFINNDEIFNYAIEAFERCNLEKIDDLLDFYFNIEINNKGDEDFTKYVINKICKGDINISRPDDLCDILNSETFKSRSFAKKIEVFNQITGFETCNEQCDAMDSINKELELIDGIEEQVIIYLGENESVPLSEFIYDHRHEINVNDVKEILNCFADEAGNVDLDHPIYCETKKKVKTNKKR